MTNKRILLTVIVVLTMSTTAVAQDEGATQGQERERGRGMMMSQGQDDGMRGMMDGDCPMMGMMMKGKDGGMGDMGGMSGMDGGMCPMCKMMGGTGADNGIMGMIPDSKQLTEQQQETLADLHAEYARQRFERTQQMRPLRDQLQELTSADSPDVRAIGKTYDELAALRKEALLERLSVKRKVRDILGEPETGTRKR